MGYHDVEMIVSAPDSSQWPDESKPEIILAGRSNVGKSSFINTILERKKLAFVGKTPGKTRLLNFFEVDQRFRIVDVPGYGYAIRSQKELIKFGNMMEEYFSQRTNLKALFIIVDFRHQPTKDDLTMLEFAQSHHIATYIIATKSDKIKNSIYQKNLKLIAETLNVSKESIIPFSSLSKKGINDVWQVIEQLV